MNDTPEYPVIDYAVPHPLAPVTSYRPPIESVCNTCGGKHFGRCPLNACNEREREYR